MSLNPTNYSKSSPNATNHGIVTRNIFYLLQESGDFLLQEDGVAKIILESGLVKTVNYSKSTPNATNYS